MRIETRFVETADGTSSLLLRVYPDTISVSSFDPALTQDEIAAGIAYWDLIWQSGNPARDDDALQAPWRVLAATFEPQRAAWIALAMTPTNLAQQPKAPTPEGQAPSPAPAFPSPPTRASSYERAPTAQALPDFWTVALYSGTTSRQVSGPPVAPGLAVALTPHDGTLPDGLPVDAGMRWLVDFDEAVKVGMGVQISLTAAERSAGFDRIIVLGLRAASADGPGNAGLAALLNAHHYTDGLALVPQGAPTKNTTDTSSAYSRKDPNYDTSFAVERLAPLTTTADCDGPVAAALLGIPTATFDHVQYADGHGVRNGRDMLTALWPATLGYFLDQMLSPVLTSSALDQARSYALSSAVPRGAVPALRVGNTPYGILPVTSLATYPPPAPTIMAIADPEAKLVGLLQKLLPAWKASVATAPHVGATRDPDQDLAQVLGMDASSIGFRARQVIGDDAMWNILGFLGTLGTDEWWLEHLARGRALLDSLGLTSWDPRVIHTSMGRASYPVPFPTVQDGALSETAPLNNDASLPGGQKGNYIQWLASASLQDLQNDNYPGTVPTSLLYRILRQSVLMEYVNLAGHAQVTNGTLAATALREPELVNISQSTPSITRWDIVNRPIATGSTVTWAQYLHDLKPLPGTQFARLGELRTSLGNLAALPTAELDRLLTETLDACSHRLDVWISAVASAILARQRTDHPAADAATLHLGGYGWVENVRPPASPAAITGAAMQAVARLDASRQAKISSSALAPLRPVFAAPADNGGFIHSPSMTQAAAGAILRSGYMSHRNTPDEPVLAIDLSSERTRSALWLLDGIRQGQTLGALTGYQFEQALHDAALDIYIQPFRKKYPLIGSELTPTTAAGAVIPPSQVTDGVALRASWQSGALAAGSNWGAGLPPPAPPANSTQNTVLGLIRDLDDMLSALGDLSLAESVFQIMRGNFGRSGGILKAVSQGGHPPEPDIVDTPRAGIDVTHRLMLLFAEAPPAVPAWSTVPTRPRAGAEPWLSWWLAGRLPDPSLVRTTVSWTAAGASHSATVTLADLAMGPLDVLALASAASAPQRSEIEKRIIYAASPPAGATALAITYDTTALPAGSIGFPDLLAAAQALRDMLGAARPLTAQDFSLPEQNVSSAGNTVDLADLNSRAQGLVSQLGADLAALRNAIADIATQVQPVLDALFTASFYGITGSVPLPAAGTAALATQASGVLAQLQERQSAASQITLPATDPESAISVIAAVLGKGALVLPHFTPVNVASVGSAFTQSAALAAVDPQGLDRWIFQLSHIRPAVERFDLAMTVTGLLGAPAPPALALGQLPPTPADRWLGLPIDPVNPPASGRVAIEALAVGDPATQAPFAGMMLDEWLDRIPSPTTAAGLSFHYDEPTSRAPQALLLAVCPDDRKSWVIGLVQTIIAETLELAKVRAVDLASIQQVGQILPGLYFPFNLRTATVGIKLLPLEAVHASAVTPTG